MKKIKYIAAVAFLTLVGASELGAQIKEEQLILNRKREPEVKKIEKKKTSIVQEKNYPPDNKKKEDSLNLRYDIVNVPMVSDFKTTEIKGEDISPKFGSDYLNNYFRIGYGNFGKMLADANISGNIEDNVEVGVDAHFLSTTGLKKDYAWDSKQNAANLSAFSNIFTEEGKYNIDVDYTLKQYNYYGVYAMTPVYDNPNFEQKVNRFSANAYYDHFSNEILNDIRVKSYFLKDHFGSNENGANVTANFSKHGFDVKNDIKANADLGVKLETVSSKFDIQDKKTNSLFDMTFSPKITFFKGESYLKIGSDFTFLNSKFGNVDGDHKENKTYWFPQLEALYAASQEFKFYVGLDGGLQINTYNNLLQENPYLISNLLLKPTENKYHFYFGLKGDFDEMIKYDFNAGFGKVRNAQFFVNNNLIDLSNSANRDYYDYANTFSNVYDDGDLLDIKGSIQYFPLQNLSLDAGLQYTQYKLDRLEESYYKPLLQLKVGANYTMLQEKLLLGFRGLFVTDRKTNAFAINYDRINNNYVSVEKKSEKVGGYADLNLSAEYKIHRNFSIFALGNNLLNTKYQNYVGYKVLGAQFLAGVKISF